MNFLGKQIANSTKKGVKNFLDSDMAKQMAYNYLKKSIDGGAVDIHKMIGKIPILKPKGGWTPSDYKYMGPYNPLDKQLEYDPESGEVIKWNIKPKNKVDEIAAHHDICYDMGLNKGDCDKKNG